MIKGPPLGPGVGPWQVLLVPVLPVLQVLPAVSSVWACCPAGFLQLSIYLVPTIGTQPWGLQVLPFRLGLATCTPPISLFHSSTQTPSRLLFASCLFLILSCTHPFPPIDAHPSHLHLLSSSPPSKIKHLLQNGRTPPKAGHCW